MRLAGTNNPTAEARGTGPCVALFFSFAPSALAPWVLRVSAITEDGTFLIGRVRVDAPSDNANPPQNHPRQFDAARITALAYCPGAKGWAVDAVAVQPTGQTLDLSKESGELFIVSDDRASSLPQPGVFLLNNDGRGPTTQPKLVPDVIATNVIVTQPCYLWKLTAAVEATFAGPLTFAPPLYLQTFDKGTAPVANDVPSWSIPGVSTIANTAATFQAYAFREDWPRGLRTRVALSIALSSRPDVFAALPGGLTLARFALSREIEPVPNILAKP